MSVPLYPVCMFCCQDKELSLPLTATGVLTIPLYFGSSTFIQADGQHLGVHWNLMPLIQLKIPVLPGLVSAAGCSSRNVLQAFCCSVSSSLWPVFQQGMRGCLSQVLQAQPNKFSWKCHSSSVPSLKASMWIALPAISRIKSRAHAGERLLSFKALALLVRSSTLSNFQVWNEHL